MLTRNLMRISVLYVITIFLFSCKTEEVILHGKIKGKVTDAEISEPIQAAKIKINQTGDTTNTGIDGTYNFSIAPGEYEIQASKYGYGSRSEIVEVVSTKTGEVNFSIKKIPSLQVSDTLLDFGVDLTSLSFTISKVGSGTLGYTISTSQIWITASPLAGEITEENDTIIITINIDKTDIAKRVHKETISISDIEKTKEVKIDVHLNGLWFGSEYKYVVLIGTQVWMSENLNVGTMIYSYTDPTDNGIIEKYCYNDNEYYCVVYGGLYSWYETMQYNPSDSGIVGTTQGICPDGWHIPTRNEYLTLFNMFGGVALMESGTDHWAPPNAYATNESGFTALPGGWLNDISRTFLALGFFGNWWSATINNPDLPDYPDRLRIDYTYGCDVGMPEFGWIQSGFSVRCIKD